MKGPYKPIRQSRPKRRCQYFEAATGKLDHVLCPSSDELENKMPDRVGAYEKTVKISRGSVHPEVSRVDLSLAHQGKARHPYIRLRRDGKGFPECISLSLREKRCVVTAN